MLFETSMKLHYSQTALYGLLLFRLFETSMKLHYSQTVKSITFGIVPFETSMKLHYSQTTLKESDKAPSFETSMKLHYSQTLLAGRWCQEEFETSMKLHYSQTMIVPSSFRKSLRPLWNYTTLKHVKFIPQAVYCLRPLWNYTTLKPRHTVWQNPLVWDLYEITLLSNMASQLPGEVWFETSMKLHYSQTTVNANNKVR